MLMPIFAIFRQSNPELDGLEKILDFQEFEKRFELKSPRENDAVLRKQEIGETKFWLMSVKSAFEVLHAL